MLCIYCFHFKCLDLALLLNRFFCIIAILKKVHRETPSHLILCMWNVEHHFKLCDEFIIVQE